ncbi:MAG: leucine-rich repeat domain-containing protein [Bacilli bacterium]|nr:leucine-rich repeat domain-containing protein [Bacilli bacterium]
MKNKRLHLAFLLLASLLSACNASSSINSSTETNGSASEKVEENKTYTVTWMNYDGKVLETDTDVEYGSVPSFDSDVPTKSTNAGYLYSFDGWYPNIVPVVSDITYKAQFSEALNSYTITWKNYDGSVLKIDKNVKHGDIPFYEGPNPTKPTTNEFAFNWCGWEPAIVETTEDKEYTAIFTNDGSLGLQLELSNDGEYYSILGPGTYNLSTLSIPTSYNEKPIKKICSYAFEKCSFLREVVIPNSIETIGSFAFENCYKLNRFETKGNINDIGATILHGCSSVEEMVLYSCKQQIYKYFDSLSQYDLYLYEDGTEAYSSDLVAYLPKDVSGYLTIFYSCETIIGGSHTYERIGGFYYHLPESFKRLEIKSGAIPDYCCYVAKNTNIRYSPLKELVLGDDVTSIGEYAFAGCKFKTKIKLGNGIRFIHEYAFFDCGPNAGWNLLLPASLEDIGAYSLAFTSMSFELNYSGTISQFGAILKRYYWNKHPEESGTIISVVHCSDGDYTVS